MEFLRFGSSIPGSYWGCCAVCIIQNFKVGPDDKASISLVDGDGGMPILDRGGKQLFAGPTYKDIFEQRLRTGTFSSNDMPNHTFFAILTDWQLGCTNGAKWLKILKENGFEFVRTVDNSVYSGKNLSISLKESSTNKNYIFALYRNIGKGGVLDAFQPPAAWTVLDKVVPEPWEYLEDKDRKTLMKGQYTAHKDIWDKLGPAKFLTEKEVVKAGAPITLAGQRSKYPQESKTNRDAKKAQAENLEAGKDVTESVFGS
jgi:hypothetical protein